jgi:hypothetical protein
MPQKPNLAESTVIRIGNITKSLTGAKDVVDDVVIDIIQ